MFHASHPHRRTRTGHHLLHHFPTPLITKSPTSPRTTAIPTTSPTLIAGRCHGTKWYHTDVQQVIKAQRGFDVIFQHQIHAISKITIDYQELNNNPVAPSRMAKTRKPCANTEKSCLGKLIQPLTNP